MNSCGHLISTPCASVVVYTPSIHQVTQLLHHLTLSFIHTHHLTTLFYCTLLHFTAPYSTSLHLTSLLNFHVHSSSGQTLNIFLMRSNLWSNFRFFSHCILHSDLTAPYCSSLCFTALRFQDSLLVMVTPSSGEPLWAPDQHPMGLCGSTPCIHQVMPLAASPHTQFHSHAPPYCT